MQFNDPLEHCLFDPARKPADASPIYYLGDVPLCTAGNLSTLLARPKAGKTAFLGGMIASVLKRDGVECDTFGIVSRNPLGKALLHFDTEQSPPDHWGVLATAMRRAKVTERPLWLRSYCLTGMNPVLVWQTVLKQIQLMRDVFNGIHSILIDGYAELVRDVNDSKETQEVVTELHRHAIKYACCIAGVLHYNPGSEKGRGHLGSQLERRAETNLNLSKTEALTEVWSDKQRKDPIPRGQGPCFAWNSEAEMHLSTPSHHKTKQAAKLKALQELAAQAFENADELRYGALCDTLISLSGKSLATAERKVQEMERLGVLHKNGGELWTLAG